MVLTLWMSEEKEKVQKLLLNIVKKWAEYLTKELLFSPDDPLFPKTRIETALTVSSSLQGYYVTICKPPTQYVKYLSKPFSMLICRIITLIASEIR